MKTLKILSILVLVLIAVSCTTKEQKANQEFRPYSLSDAAFTKYLSLDTKTDSIKEAVVTLAQLYLNESRVDILDTVLLAYCDAVGVEEVAKYVSTTDKTRYAWPDYPPKDIMDIILQNNELKSSILAKTIRGHDLKSALWTFCITPKVIFDRLSPSNTWYTPAVRGEIKRNLIEYYDDSMGRDIAIKIASITPDEMMINYMGDTLEQVIHEVNPQRVINIYSKMTSYDIVRVAQMEEPSKIFETIGKQAYLKANLSKANCTDLSNLYTAGLISKATYNKLFAQKSAKEKLAFANQY